MTSPLNGHGAADRVSGEPPSHELGNLDYVGLTVGRFPYENDLFSTR
ncbi:hypothetical protein [Neorhizobium galegae]|nr:hypothetical protein [Neorhizobium galegae]